MYAPLFVKKKKKTFKQTHTPSQALYIILCILLQLCFEGRKKNIQLIPANIDQSIFCLVFLRPFFE